MKKLTLSVLIASAMSMPAMAGDDEAKIQSSFSALDSDGNGVVSLQEAKESDASKVLMKMDENDDDRITKSEYVAFVNEHPRKFSDDVVMSVRAEGTTDAVLVRDGNTTLTSDAMLTADSSKTHGDRTMNGKVSGNYDPQHDQENRREKRDDDSFVAFEMIDKDNDGELTKSEVDKVDVDADFDEMDMDDDNLITRLEYNEFVIDADIE
ncbi:hypothetical protein GTH32_14460 [Alteromonas sp. 345S023]|uniref:EF-hand domain-containing protein n=1 Tax=Alteromonas profundi TaxID=2696062 RepID=A0A7X5LPH8_9ALTE|nr:hypothetical protein [Alteromonas profundi]NDV92380.1 hypothetical protein [Alteromonas profundi]